MELTIKEIVCSACGKKHSTNNFKLIPMMGANFAEIVRDTNQVYMHDTGGLRVTCECGYMTSLDRLMHL